MGIADYIKDFLESKVRKAIRMVEHEFLHDLVYGIKGFTRYVMRQFLATLLIAAALGALALALLAFFVEYLALTKTLAFLIIGILLLLIGLVLKLQR